MKSRTVFFATVLTMLYMPVAQPDSPTFTHIEIEKVEVKGIDNFTQIEESSGFAGTRVGFGGATQGGAMSSLKSQGYVTVINLRLADEENVDLQGNTEAAKAAGLNYIHLPFDTSKPAAEVVDNFLTIVGNQANQPVYIHCGSATRAAALWMIGRVVVDDWDPSMASAEVEKIARKPTQAIGFATAYLEALEN